LAQKLKKKEKNIKNKIPKVITFLEREKKNNIAWIQSSLKKIFL